MACFSFNCCTTMDDGLVNPKANEEKENERGTNYSFGSSSASSLLLHLICRHSAEELFKNLRILRFWPRTLQKKETENNNILFVCEISPSKKEKGPINWNECINDICFEERHRIWWWQHWSDSHTQIIMYR